MKKMLYEVSVPGQPDSCTQHFERLALAESYVRTMWWWLNRTSRQPASKYPILEQVETDARSIEEQDREELYGN